jgi:hypothetical protein
MSTQLVSDETIARIKKFDCNLVTDAKDRKRTMQLRFMCYHSNSERMMMVPTHLESSAAFEFFAFNFPQKSCEAL